MLAQPPVSQPVSQAVSPLSVTPGYQVLMINDDLALTERLQAEAAAWGLQMQVVSNPAEARSRLMRVSPDVVLLDLSFPSAEEDGLTLLREITARTPDLPVIVFTGRDSLADRLAVSRLGARQFLANSFLKTVFPNSSSRVGLTI